MSHLVYPNIALPFAATPYTLAPGANATHTWPGTTTSDRSYDLSVYGPDRFLRRFAGVATPTAPTAHALTLTGAARGLGLVLGNPGAAPVTFTLTANDFATLTSTVTVAPGGTATTTVWPVDTWGYYDVVVTAPGPFRYRFAGRVA